MVSVAKEHTTTSKSVNRAFLREISDLGRFLEAITAMSPAKRKVLMLEIQKMTTNSQEKKQTG